MDSTEKAVGILQLINTVVASVSTILLYTYIIHRIKLNHASLTQYQNFLVVQALVYICGSVLTLLLNERVTLKMEDQLGYPFITTPLFGKIGHFYTVAGPLAFLCTVFFGIASAFFEDTIRYYCMCGYYVTILSVMCICFYILRRHFRVNAYSDVVRKAQNKLSKGLLLQILIQIIALVLLGLGPVWSLLGSLFNLEDNIIFTTGGIYLVIVYVVFAWYPLFIGFIIKWSISGLLTVKRPAQKVSVPNEPTLPKVK
ncbi:hypothetical protein GCK32_007557 [Trichostrongylus colubriformis]|uniref:Uncharacterized protein n=1 Tax=Trichostrongylus colubriformis TaxID=6319 RepID=A0AAN8FFD5_TRICO